MVKRCKDCSITIDSGNLCQTCYNEKMAAIPRLVPKDNIFSETSPIADPSNKPSISMTLPTDSNERKDYPLMSGCLKYFPAALAGISNISKKGNDKHNPGEKLHHARGKSMDHGDCILRHLLDVEDLIAAYNRGNNSVTKEMILTEVSQMAWRALAYAQLLQETFGAPIAPAAKYNKMDDR